MFPNVIIYSYLNNNVILADNKAPFFTYRLIIFYRSFFLFHIAKIYYPVTSTSFYPRLNSLSFMDNNNVGRTFVFGLFIKSVFDLISHLYYLSE